MSSAVSSPLRTRGGFPRLEDCLGGKLRDPVCLLASKLVQGVLKERLLGAMGSRAQEHKGMQLEQIHAASSANHQVLTT